MRVKAGVTCSVLYRLWVTVLASPLVSVGFAGSVWVSLPRLVRDGYGAGVWLIGAMATADADGSIIAALTYRECTQVTAWHRCLCCGYRRRVRPPSPCD